MKSLLILLALIVLICTVNGQKQDHGHDHKPNKTENGTHPSPMPGDITKPELIDGQINPASVCLGKNSTDDKIFCIVEIISRMQLELAERRGMIQSWKGKKMDGNCWRFYCWNNYFILCY